MRHSVLVMLSTLFACSGAFAQAPDCQRPAGVPAWMPCGPDRILSEQELRAVLLDPSRPTRVAMTGGGPARRQYALELLPGGKLALQVGDGANIGRDWKVDTGSLCLRAYQSLWAGAWNCGEVFVQEGGLYWLDEHGGFRNVIVQVSR